MSASQRSAQDILAIQAVVVRYGFLVDDCQWDAFDEVFTEDAVVDFRDQDAEPPRGLKPMVGRDEIVRVFRDVLTHPLQHMILNHLIDDVTDDEVLVRSKTFLPLPRSEFSHAMYRDVAVRTPEGWRIKHKTVKRYGPQEISPWYANQAELWRSRGAEFE